MSMMSSLSDFFQFMRSIKTIMPITPGKGHDYTWRNSKRAKSLKSRANRRKAMRRAKNG